jgi:alpha-ketoglutarate-dependent taurine dioxygenase
MSQRPIAGARRKAVDLSEENAVRIHRYDDNPLTPWVVEPARPDVELAAWAAENQATVDAKLLDTGAVLFRGFEVRSPEYFEQVAAALTNELYGGYGDLPRVGESPNIYESTPYPPDQAILFHNESSHLPSWPMRISFCCLVAAEVGGETPIADCRVMAERLDPAVLERFREKGLSYIRNFAGLDVSWQQFFGTDDREDVERRCLEGGAEIEWKDGDRLCVRQPAAAIRSHPATGDTLFFNQLQLHHPYFLQAEVRESLLSMFAPEDLPRNVLYGDGTPIENEVAEHVSELYWDTSVRFPWQAGDVIMLDNMRTAHARMPYSGERRIAVAMSGITSG